MHFGISVAGASMGSGKRWSWSLAALAVIGASACGDNNNSRASDGDDDHDDAATNAQTGVVGTALAQPVGVIVADQNGAPLANATVNWTIDGGRRERRVGDERHGRNRQRDGRVDARHHRRNGLAQASIAGGANTFIAATATAAAASAVHVTSADTLTVTAGTTTAPLVVKVVDQFANPVASATVTWAVTGGGTLSATTSTTDATGYDASDADDGSRRRGTTP